MKKIGYLASLIIIIAAVSYPPIQGISQHKDLTTNTTTSVVNVTNTHSDTIAFEVALRQKLNEIKADAKKKGKPNPIPKIVAQIAQQY